MLYQMGISSKHEPFKKSRGALTKQESSMQAGHKIYSKLHENESDCLTWQSIIQLEIFISLFSLYKSSSLLDLYQGLIRRERMHSHQRKFPGEFIIFTDFFYKKGKIFIGVKKIIPFQLLPCKINVSSFPLNQ